MKIALTPQPAAAALVPNPFPAENWSPEHHGGPGGQRPTPSTSTVKTQTFYCICCVADFHGIIFCQFISFQSHFQISYYHSTCLEKGALFCREGCRDVSVSIISINDDSIIDATVTFDCIAGKNSTVLYSHMDSFVLLEA